MIILLFVLVGQATGTTPDVATVVPSETPELSCFSDSLCYAPECHYRRKAENVYPTQDTFSGGLEAVISCGNINAYFKCPDNQEIPEECNIQYFCYTYESADSKGKLEEFYALEVSVGNSKGTIECRTDNGECPKYPDKNKEIDFIIGMSNSCYSQSISDSGLSLPSVFRNLSCNCPGAPCTFTRELQVDLKNDKYGSKIKILFHCFEVKVVMQCPEGAYQCNNVRQCYKYVNGNSSFGVIEMVVPKVYSNKGMVAPVCLYNKGNCPVFYDTPSETKYVISLRSDCTKDATTV